MRTEAIIAAVVGVVVVGAVLPAGADVLCEKKTGALFVRAACKKKETQVDPASIGAKGPQGSQGIQGPPGPPGPAGQPTTIDFRAGANTPSTTIFDSGKLQITASCDGGGTLSVIATTSVDHAVLRSYGNGSASSSDDFVIATPLTITPTQSEERDFVYTEPSGQIVIVQWAASNSSPLGGSVPCLVSGLAFVH